jgi:hypothetical protein
MPITINEPLVLSEVKNYKPIQQRSNWHNGQGFAEVMYGLFDEEGNRISGQEKTISYSGAEFNTWWESFNNGSFLDEELLRVLEIEATLPQDNEYYYTNQVEGQPNEEN